METVKAFMKAIFTNHSSKVDITKRELFGCGFVLVLGTLTIVNALVANWIVTVISAVVTYFIAKRTIESRASRIEDHQAGISVNSEY